MRAKSIVIIVLIFTISAFSQTLPPGVQQKENAQFEAGMRLKMSDADPDYPAMVLANYR